MLDHHVQRVVPSHPLSYLQPLKVISVDFGSTFPLVRSARSVAGPLNSAPGAPPWPQLILDLAYRWVGRHFVCLLNLVSYLQRKHPHLLLSNISEFPPCRSGRISMTVSTVVELQQAGLVKKLQAAFGKKAGLQQPQQEGGAGGASAGAGANDEGAPAGPSASGMAAGSTCTGGSSGGGGMLAGLMGLGRAAAAKAGSLAAGLTESLPPIKFQLEIVITRFEVELMLWTAPPPSDRWALVA